MHCHNGIADTGGNGHIDRPESGRNHGIGKERLMKNKIPIILLGCAFVFSVGLNIYLFWSLSETRGQVTVFSSRVVTADEQITDLQEQLAGLEELQGQVADLQASLSQSNEQIASLETSLAESNEQIGNLENTIGENNATIAALEEQLAEAQRKQQANAGGSNNNSNIKPVNPMPAGPSIDWHDSSGIGDGSGAIGSFGTYE